MPRFLRPLFPFCAAALLALALLALASVVLAGCAAPRSQAGLPPEAGRYEPPPAGMAQIVFYRQAVPFLQAVEPDLVVNGKKVGTAVPGGTFVRRARPGGYEGFSGHAPDTVISFTLQPGETRYVKTAPAFRDLGFRLAAGEVPERRALAELQDLGLERRSTAGLSGAAPGQTPVIRR